MKGQIPQLGVCYYPEHWPESQWEDDARRMAELGISIVRVGEFAWSRMEPSRGEFQFDWLRRAIEGLHAFGLKVVLGTPTATPPRWLVDEMPDMLPVTEDGNTRGFGSRRHYCFSHAGYREECARITTRLADEFGNHPAVVAWQTDNEYDCHDTALSWSRSAEAEFRDWLSQKYQSIDALNSAWGNVFWSMEYSSIDQVALPGSAVTEENPAHIMDFRRFASDQVASFNRLQTNILRAKSPGRDIIHNFMGRTLTFDHFDVGQDLDISSWDSYPLGFLEDRSARPDEFKQQFANAGDPDNQAFHHDLYRATSGGRWWVMEQQPGPVNWAPHNPCPRDGMVRLWTWEAIGHGAEVVSYFRWKQAPFAQEQMHAGLLRPDGKEAHAFFEAEQVQKDMKALGENGHLDAIGQSPVSADVAIVFDYPSAWAWQIQPQGRQFDYFRLVFDFYKSLRGLGQAVDFIASNETDLSNYKAIFVPGLFAWNESLLTALRDFDGKVLIGPRSGSKSEDFSFPSRMPPNLPKAMMDVVVSRVGSLRSDCPIEAGSGAVQFWREEVEVGPQAETIHSASDGLPLLVSQADINYLAGWPDDLLMNELLTEFCSSAGLETLDLSPAIRVTRRGAYLFVFNYGDTETDLSDLGIKGQPILGSNVLELSGVAVLKTH